MDSSRGVGIGVAAAALTLVGTGAAAAWALRQGFYATLLVAALAAVWLAILLWWTVVRPRDSLAPRHDSGSIDSERILLRVLLDHTPGPLLAIERDQVRALNRAARTLFATDDHILAPPPALLASGAARLRLAGRNWRIDRVAVQSLGESRTVVALVDVEPEEHAAEARATRELLRVLGHEVMNALAPIASLAESAIGVLAAPERRDRLLPEILDTLAHRTEGLRRFTDAYRQVGRLPEPAVAPVRIADLFAEIIRLFDSEWHGRAALQVEDAGGALASLDREQIVQALLALLRNGVEATTATAADPVVMLSATIDAGRVNFLVVDNGPGVGAAHRASIFLPFFTTKKGGSGIGLTAARQIALGHGGDIFLRPGLPTTFGLGLPQ